MIGMLRGEIVYKRPPSLMLDVGGVGYEVQAPMSTFYDLPSAGERVTLVTHLIVRDDTMVLYGFLRDADRTLFQELLKVNGVGARMALAILSGMDSQQFVLCLREQDVSALTRLPGIGNKTAQRLLVELRDRLDSLSPGLPLPADSPPPAASGEDSALAEAVSALVALGYKPVEANRMAGAADDGAKTSEEIIRAALKAVKTA